jgi:hypothetical protein
MTAIVKHDTIPNQHRRSNEPGNLPNNEHRHRLVDGSDVSADTYSHTVLLRSPCVFVDDRENVFFAGGRRSPRRVSAVIPLSQTDT